MVIKDPPEWRLPGSPCIHCGFLVTDIDSHNLPCAKSPSGRHMLMLPPKVNDIYMVGIVPDEPPF